MPNDRKESVGVLKTIWRRDDAGKWCVHGAHPIDLKPRKGDDANCFRLDNTFNIMTDRPGPIFKDLFATFGSAEFLLRQSVVPVVAWNDGDAVMRCIGTGFFISASGLMLTAGHVMRDPVDEKYASLTLIEERAYQIGAGLHLGILLPVNPAMRNAPFDIPDELRAARTLICPIEWAQHWGHTVDTPLFDRDPDFKLDLDIAVCKVKENPLGGAYQPLNIGPHSLIVGDRAVAIGYARMENIPLRSDQPVDPELMISVGRVTRIYPDNITEKLTPTPGPCFDFDAHIPGKMSGGPILVGSGILAKGVVSRSWQDEKFATGCLIAPIMSIALAAVRKSLLELMMTGNEGMAVFQGGGRI
jgi:hypothetical protein